MNDYEENIEFLNKIYKDVCKFTEAEFSVIVKYGPIIQDLKTKIAIYKFSNSFETDISVRGKKIEISDEICEKIKEYVIENLKLLTQCIPNISNEDDKREDIRLLDGEEFRDISVHLNGFTISVSATTSNPNSDKICDKIIKDICRICNIKV